MSQFAFGEIILQNQREATPLCSELTDYPFSFRFTLQPYDYYISIAPSNNTAIPFVIADSAIDNTCELLLCGDNIYGEQSGYPSYYDGLLLKPVFERTFLIAKAVDEALTRLGATEAILVLCSGTGIPTECSECYIDEFHKELLQRINETQFFLEVCFRIKRR